MSEGRASHDLGQAYREYDCRLRIRRLMIANAITAVGMMSGVGLDYFVYPAKLLPFLALRIGVVVVLGVITALLRLRPVENKPRLIGALGVGVTLVVSLSFCLMIWATNGALSPYIVAVILIVMAMSVMLPWTVWETAATCFGTLLFYVAACLWNPTFSQPEAGPIFAFNCSFITITGGVCVTITYFLARSRFDEFSLRHQLDVQNRELQDLDRLKTQFFSNVSHELRTPLTLILSPIESLLGRSQPLEPAVHEVLILVQRNSLRLLKLINDLLDLTRLDQGSEVLRKRRIVVGTFVRGVVDSVRHLGLSKKIRMHVEAGDPAVEVAADGSRLEKVLVNLLTNAIKYTPAGGSITVRWKQEADQVLLEVSDTGVGIPPEDIPKIFDRFHQVRGNSSNQLQGIGIGLALVREIVEQHGGRISVESEVGKGSTFRIALPQSDEVVEEEPVLEPDLAETSEGEEPFEKAFRSADRTWRPETDTREMLPTIGAGDRVVLVADDEVDMRQYIVSLLAEDYRVVQTQRGGNVVDLVKEHEPDVVLLDWMMPEKDGLEVCRELRSDPVNRDRKIMLLTARIDEKSKIDALKAGADDFLTKPFSSVEVKTRVGNLLRVAALQKDLRTRNEELSETIEKLQRTERLLIQSEKMNALGTLSAGLLHEINNPLNYTLTAVSFAKQFRSSLSEEMQDVLSDIEEGMGRIRDVVTHLKNFAYPEKAGEGVVFEVEECVLSAKKIVSNELDEIEVTIDLPEGLAVQGQKTQITHLFINLFSNAAKALARHEVPVKKITVVGTIEDGEGIIRFADNGPGIPEENLTRIFDPFFTTRDVGAGMGMGLSICQTIMETHRGSIRAHNEGGAVFTIQLPLAEAALKIC